MSTSFSVGAQVVMPAAVDGYAHTRDSRHSFNTVPGAAAAIVVVFPASLRNGSMTAVFTNYAAAATFDRLLAGTQPITFLDSDYPDTNMIFLLNGRGGVAQSAARRAWIVTFDFQEIVP